MRTRMLSVSAVILLTSVFFLACGAGDGSTQAVDGGDGADPPTTDGGTADGGTTDSETADGGTTDSGTADGGTTDSGTADGGTTDGGLVPPAGRPGPTNTGVPAGMTLTKSTGDLDITAAGTIIDRRDIDGCVNVRAKNVIIRNTRVSCSGYYPVRVFDNASLIIEDTEIAASGALATSGIAFSNYTARRVNVHGAADGMKADSNVLIEDSWIHDLWLAPGDHADGVQGTGGSNVTVRRNNIDIVDHGKGHGGDSNSCFQVGDENGKNGNWVIDGNWLSGGGWVINFFSGLSGNQIVNNRFSRAYGYGPISTRGTSPVTVTGNVWDDTGELIK